MSNLWGHRRSATINWTKFSYKAPVQFNLLDNKEKKCKNNHRYTGF